MSCLRIVGWLPLLALALPAAAHASASVDTRLPIGEAPAWAPSSVRFYTDTGLLGPAPGVDALLFRTGPIWSAGPLLTLGANAVVSVSRNDENLLTQRLAGEVEAQLQNQFGPLGINYRNRLNYTWQGAGQSPWLDRNLLRLNYHLEGTPLRPFVYDELYTSLGEGLWSTNVTGAGVGWSPYDFIRLDIYLTYAVKPAQSGDLAFNVLLLYSPERAAVALNDLPSL